MLSVLRYAAPARLGRRRTDQLGHLLLTDLDLIFRGRVEMQFPWMDVARVDHDGNQVVVALRRAGVLRFYCRLEDEARKAAIIAAHLLDLVQVDAVESV